MAKNLIPEIAKMLGVELGEEFKIDKYDGLIFKFVDNKLMTTRPDYKGATWVTPYATFNELVGGEVGVIKLPWKPQMFETYCSFDIVYGKLVVCYLKWTGLPYQYALLDRGWVYRTRSEAQAALPSVAKELDVEYKL